MLTDIIFLPEVPETQKQAVLDFVSLWQSDEKHITVYTSGSTGLPKSINVLKKVMVASANTTNQFFNFNSDFTILLNLSATYIAGMMQIVRAIECELKLVVAPVCSNPLSFVHQPIDFAAFVPLQVSSILSDKNARVKYEQIKNVIIGGAPINDQLFNDISILSNHSYATFGMTETVSHIALKKIEKYNDYYIALPNVSFDKTEQDCLVINAPSISDTTIITTDRVDLKDKNSFKWLGRADFVINSGGIKIQPEEVERKIAKFISSAFYISKERDEFLGDKVVLIIEGQPYSNEKTEGLKAKLLSELSKFEVPKVIGFKREFQRTHTGKIKRQ